MNTSNPLSKIFAIIYGAAALFLGAMLIGAMCYAIFFGLGHGGFFDWTIAAMTVAFGYKSIMFGHDVVTGRQTVVGEYVA